MAYETILYQKKGAVGIITLNRPARKNALNLQVMREIAAVLDEIARDGEVKAVVITGGQECFSAGADLKETPLETSFMLAGKDEALGAMKKIENLEKPIIAAISGLCLGGGLLIAILCDLRIASETAVLGLPEMKFGMVAASGGTQRLPRIIGMGKAKEIYYTGDPVDVQEAYRIGLVNKVVPVESLMDEANRMANTLADRSSTALRMAKSLINASMGTDLDTAMDLEQEVFEKLSEPESKEAQKRAAEREQPYKKFFR